MKEETYVKRVQAIPRPLVTLLTSLAWPLAARFVQPTGRAATVQIKQLFRLTLTQVCKTVMASGMGPMLAWWATAAAAGPTGARTVKADAAPRRAKRARDLNMAKGRKNEVEC